MERAAGTRDALRRDVLAVATFAVVAMGVLTWAKWNPYSHKLPAAIADPHAGPSVLLDADGVTPEVSWRAGWEFATGYLAAVWPALVAGLVLAAMVETVLPRRWLAAALRPGTRGNAGAAVLALPSMMCTCCAAPVAVALRRRRIALAPALTWWVANPALNPFALALCTVVLGWDWAALRAVAGLALVALVTRSAARLDRREGPPATRLVDDDGGATTGTGAAAASPDTGTDPGRFFRALVRSIMRLGPEYAVLLLALGALRGHIPPVADGLGGWAPVAVVLVALAATLIAVPTAGEVAVVAALLSADVPATVAAAVLIPLPAVSLPSLVVLRRHVPARLLVDVAGLTVALGVLTAAAAWVIGL